MRFRILIAAFALLAAAIALDGWTTYYLIEVVGGFYETNAWAFDMFSTMGYTVGIFMVFAGKVLLISVVGLIAAFARRGVLMATFGAFVFAALHFYAGYQNWLLIP